MNPRDSSAIDAARLYYERGLSQADVAGALGVSRPTVSKLIQHAKDRGFVTVTINDPRDDDSALADALRRTFGLTQVRLSRSSSDAASTLSELGQAGADVLGEQVRDGDLVGVTWGETMYAVARHLTPQPRTGVEMIALKGGSSLTSRSTGDAETIGLFCDAFHAHARTLPLPVIFDNAAAKAIVEQERHIRHVIDLGREAQVAIFTVGAVEPSAMLFNLGYLTDSEQQYLLEHAAGDLCSRFFDDSGAVCLPELDARTVGVPLADLRLKRTRILVAGGAAKLRGLTVALRAGYATHLVTDATTARLVLEAAVEE